MKKIGFLFILLISAFTSLAQIKALTNTGEEVVLYENGTWKYTNSIDSVKKVIETSDKTFTKPKDASFEVKSNILSMGIYINPKSWTFKKGEENEPAEYNFENKGKDVYAMLISEKTMVPIESLRNIALKNAQSAAPDTKVITEEYRIVNGTKVLFMQMEGTIEGISFVYLGYYYSCEKGIMQFLTYTTQNLLAENRSNLEDLLNGLVVTK